MCYCCIVFFFNGIVTSESWYFAFVCLLCCCSLLLQLRVDGFFIFLFNFCILYDQVLPASFLFCFVTSESWWLLPMGWAQVRSWYVISDLGPKYAILYTYWKWVWVQVLLLVQVRVLKNTDRTRTSGNTSSLKFLRGAKKYPKKPNGY